MIINTDKLIKLVENADGIFLSPEGEETLRDFLEVKEQVENAELLIKAQLEKTALKINPNFSMIQGDSIKINYRAFGSRYKFDIQTTPEQFIDVKPTYSLNTKELENYLKDHKLPKGIEVVERPKKVIISEVSSQL